MFSHKNNNLLPIIPEKFRRNDTNTVYLFTNARDEPNIAEWVAHHLLLGFDKVFVFDHLSINPISNILTTKFEGRVKVLRVYGSGNIKMNLMMDAVNISKKDNVSWMLYLDADEFLLLNKHQNVKDYLRNFTHADSVGVNWLMFGSSGHITQPKGLITENFIRSELRLNQHVKTFIRPSVVLNVVNPHWYVISKPNRCYSGAGTKMPMGPFNIQPLPFIKSPAYIAHYFMQSENEYNRRKGRQMDDGTGTKLGITEIHKTFNDIANNQLQNKYSQKTKELLEQNNIFL